MRKRKNRLTREDCIRNLSSIQLPRSVSKSIGEIGFLKEHQLEGDEVFYRPIIEIHPKDAPQNVKELWMSMYERVSDFIFGVAVQFQVDVKIWPNISASAGTKRRAKLETPHLSVRL
jgi:hypothetical protein